MTETVKNESQDQVTSIESNGLYSSTDVDPLSILEPSETANEGDFVLLIFSDGKQIFAEVLRDSRGKNPPVKINKRTYSTKKLIGLPYGSVLELNRKEGLLPLGPNADLVPELKKINTVHGHEENVDDDKLNAESNSELNDNRHLTDANTAQNLTQSHLASLRDKGIDGSEIVAQIVQNSSTFSSKTSFSQAKYINRKQLKYQTRCRMVRCNASTITEAMFLKEPRKILNMREDSLAQILSNSNISAGSRVLVIDSVMGVVVGSLAQRMGGYGEILSLYSGQQPNCLDLLQRFNLSFGEERSISWVHTGDVFHGTNENKAEAVDEDDFESKERSNLSWPCWLHIHTRNYLETMETDKEKVKFLDKRCARFARKLTRQTTIEANHALIKGRKCDSLILACKYDPTPTLLTLLPFLASSSPFVIYNEFLEPLVECFDKIQSMNLAINLRLTDTWQREYQMLPGRTHPNMTMSQNGGFILTGIKLCEVYGRNELDGDVIKDIRKDQKRGRKRNKDIKKKNLGTDTIPQSQKRVKVDTKIS